LDNKRNKIELSESDKPTVTVRLKRGAWEVEITTREDRVQQAVESVLAGMASREPALVEQPEGGAAERRGETSRSVITAMWKEGWFASPRSLSEVHEEMSRRGYHYDRTAVSHTLVDLVREGSLFRDGSMRNYRYVQKYPFKGGSGTS
jgi:acyl carrier protein phosphodiesterase